MSPSKPWWRRALWGATSRVCGSHERACWYLDRAWRRSMDFYRRRVWLLTPVDATLRLLEVKGLLPHPFIALEVFGRHGLWKTLDYAARCDYLEHYELNAEYAGFAERVLPKEKTIVRAADSIDAIRNGKLLRRDYSFVISDNGSSEFGDGYCEHFDLFPAIYGYLAMRSVIVVNLFLEVSEEQEKRLERRAEFYGLSTIEQAAHIDLFTALDAYRRKAQQARFWVDDLFVVPHPGSTLFAVMCLSRKETV